MAQEKTTLTPAARSAGEIFARQIVADRVPLTAALAIARQLIINAALASTKNNRTQAAKLLGCARNTLLTFLRKVPKPT